MVKYFQYCRRHQQDETEDSSGFGCLQKIPTYSGYGGDHSGL